MSLIPQIRFTGFTDNWEQRKLGDIVEFFSGLTYSPDDTVAKNGTFVLRSSNVKGGELVNADDVYVDSSVVNSTNVKIGDIIVVVRNGSKNLIGKHAQVKFDMENTVIGAFMTGIRGPESNFINALLDTEQFKIEISKNLGATINQITTGAFKNMLFFVTPNINEQQQIGSFFKQLDDTIALHQRQLELLKEQKKGFLQKMFPKNGASKPELRFSGFTDDWEQRKLGEIFKILDGDRGKNYPGEKDFFDQEETLFLDTGNVKKNGFEFSKKKFITREKDTSLRSGKLELYDFVLTSRGTLGNVAYYDKKIVQDHPSIRINSAMLILRPCIQDKVSDNFMASVLRGTVIDTFMLKNHVGSAQPHITKKDFSNVDINIPKTLEEQKKIGSFFKQLDDTIALHQRQLELLKEQKKGFLQKMFV